MLIREKGQIIINWYQKPTNTDRILNYNSSHKIQLKQNIVFKLVDRALLLSDRKFHNFNLNFINKLLINNAYLKIFIDLCVRERMRKIRQNVNNLKHDNSNKILCTVSMPYKPIFYSKCSSRSPPMVPQEILKARLETIVFHCLMLNHSGNVIIQFFNLRRTPSQVNY